MAIGIMLGALVAVASFAAVTRLSQLDRWLLAGTGILGGALALFCGRLPRFVIGGVSMAAAGVLVAFSGLPLEAGLGILFRFFGLIALASGGIVFLRFVRQTIETGVLR